MYLCCPSRATLMSRLPRLLAALVTIADALGRSLRYMRLAGSDVVSGARMGASLAPAKGGSGSFLAFSESGEIAPLSSIVFSGARLGDDGCVAAVSPRI